MEVNVQCQQILEGIEQLEKYLQERIAKEALDLDSNYETTRNQELLLRLKKSLLQYTDRGKNLVYVGFMGHFSAGKSSTINSLLGLEENSEEARRVGLNPVDKSITLITHSENKDSVFNTTKEGLVSIRANFSDNELLKDIVIADTPGTGDPILASEIAKDFLPICDLIIYFFSAAIPLDSADVPLLNEKCAQLAFIPIRFVVTRADEFKKNHEITFGAENFNVIQANVFLNELSQRINHLFKNDPYLDSNSIFLIDNKSQFNIDRLRELILEFSNVSDIQSQINIHSHKIVYFKSSAEALKSFFCDFLLDKLEILSSIIKISQTNIDRFQGKIRLTNNALTESWNKRITSINSTKYGVYKELSPVPDLPESIDLFCFRNGNSSFLEFHIKRAVDERATLAKEGIKHNIIPLLRNDISDNKRRINNILSLGNLIGSEFLELKVPSLQKDKIFVNIDLLPPALLFSEASKIRSEADSNLAQCQRQLESALETLKKMLAEQIPIKEYQSLLSSATGDLDNDFDAYFDSITIYRTGVFSLNVKEAISKLGLGYRMDTLEADELTDEQKAVIKQDAQEHIYPGISRIFVDILKSCVDLQVRIEELQRKIKAMALSRGIATGSSIEDWKDAELAVIKDEMASETESDVNRFRQITNIKIREILARFVNEWETEVSKMKAERRKRFLLFTLLFGLGGLSLYVLYIYGAQRDVSNNIFVASVFGVIVNLASNVVGFAWAKFTDKFPISIKAKESSILGRFREEYLQAVNDGIDSLQDSINPDSQVLYNFWKKLLVTEPLKEWSVNKASFYEILKTFQEEYAEMHREYLRIVDAATELASSYFTDPDTNLQKLSDFSEKLQQTAIKPSFDLLAETKANLDTVIQNIQEIDFA